MKDKRRMFNPQRKLQRDRHGQYWIDAAWAGKLLRKDWRDRIRIGDVLKAASGTLRVVRSCLYKANGRLHSVNFTIQRCSWTNACFTIYGRSDLKTFGFLPTGAKAKMATALDRKIAREIFDQRLLEHEDRRLHCCDVRGIA